MESIEKVPQLEHLFYEANANGIPTIAVIDQGNEMGSGTIEEEVRRVVPYGDICQCPCKSGLACSVKADIVLPANISNWGAYAISAMLAVLLHKADILQDAATEYRMLEACIMAGACDGPTGKPIMQVDAVPHEANEGLVSLLKGIVGNALLGTRVETRFGK